MSVLFSTLGRRVGTLKFLVLIILAAHFEERENENKNLRTTEYTDVWDAYATDPG